MGGDFNKTEYQERLQVGFWNSQAGQEKPCKEEAMSVTAKG